MKFKLSSANLRISSAAITVWATMALAGIPASAQEPTQPENTFAVQASETVAASDYMVIAAHPLAAEAGRAVLAEGGSAADAAVAVQLMLGLVEPQSSGLGGGAFALYWHAASGSLTSHDGRETAPLAATPDYWLGPDKAPIGWGEAVPGGLSVGVPGTPALLQHLHDRFGTMDKARLAAPAIAAAVDGFTVTSRLAASVTEAADQGLALFPITAAYFLPGGTPLAEGSLLRNPAYADTLRAFVSEGAAPFYTGPLAEAVIATTRDATINPGMLTATDFATYEVKERAPVCHPYRAYRVCGMGPPSSGALTVGQILMMLDQFDLGAAPNAEVWRLFAEASRLAFADRGHYMADSDFVSMPEGLLNPAYLAGRAALIDARRAGDAKAGEPPWKEGTLRAPDRETERPGTSHFVIRDRAGNILSMTTTIETGFGSRLMANGYLLNNELTDFSRTPSDDGKPVANRVEGGKRPRSSMAPTIVFEGEKPVMVLGSPGGSRIISYVAKTMIAVIDWGLSPSQAISLGHITAAGDRVDLEAGTDAALLASVMMAYGLETSVRDLNSGLAVMIMDDMAMFGAADPRREGVVLGE